MKKEAGAQKPSQWICLQARGILAIAAFLGNIFVYGLRINISVAIVCMVRESVTNGTNTTQAPDPEGCGQLEKAARTGQGEFDWDRSTRGYVLSAFFWGYILTQIPGGWLSGRVGGKHVHGLGMLVATVCNLLIPVSARLHVVLVIILRFIIGFCTGVSFPAIATIWGRWAPPLERSKLLAFEKSGTMVGNIVTLSTSGLLCATRVDGGWPLIFYVIGGAALLWWVFWTLFVYSTPASHPRISAEERRYIEDSIGHGNKDKSVSKVPWRHILTSGPFWAIFFTHMCNNFGNYTLMTGLPTYMREVLKFDIRQNGLLSALPFIAQFLMAQVFGQMADFARERKYLSTTTVRKMAQIIAFLPPAACLVAAGFVTCHQRALAVFLLTASAGINAATRCGWGANHVDIAPRYSGVLYGLTNTAGTIPGIISPLMISAFTPNGTRAEWLRVFGVVAGAYVLGTIVYLLLASGEEQTWAKPDFLVTIHDIPCHNKDPDDKLSNSKTEQQMEGRTNLAYSEESTKL